jgi:hypothetical protein
MITLQWEIHQPAVKKAFPGLILDRMGARSHD